MSEPSPTTTPWLIRASGPLASFLDRKLPPPLQTFTALYGTWIESLRSEPSHGEAGTRVRRVLRLLLLDLGLLALLVVGATAFGDSLVGYVVREFELSRRVARYIVVALGLIAGRAIWRVVARSIGVVDDPATPLVAALAVIVAAMVIVNLAALVPGRSARRIRAASVLRSA